MTITSQVREATATGNGIATSFPYEFIIPDEAYAHVFTEVIATGVETELSPLLYTITGIGDPDGGAVEYPLVGSPLAATHRLIIRRNVEYIQEVDISTQSGFNASVVEAQLDLMVMMIQQLAQGSDTALSETLSAADAAYASQVAAAASESAAATSANNANAQRVLADAAAAAAAASAATATTQAGNASTSAASAAASLASVIAGALGTSVTSQDPSTTGSKTWVTQAGKAWQIGQRLRVASDSGDKVQEGVVTSYSGTSLQILVDFNAGSAGAHTDWNISVTGERGPAGPSGAGTGDVVGPASAVDSHIVLFNGASGKLVKSAATLFSDMATKVYADSAVSTAITAIKGGVAAAFDTLSELAAGLALKFDIAGGTITGDTTLSKAAAAALLVESTGAAASVTVKAAAGLNSDVILNEAAVAAWYLRSDGSDNTFKLRATRPSDSALIVPMSVDRETGVAEFIGVTQGGSSLLAQAAKFTAFTADGTWTRDARTKYVRFRAVGGGGGGGGSTGGSASTGGGGCSGSAAEAILTAANAGASAAIGIGAAGVAGAAGNNDGGNGGATTVGTLISCPGGIGGNGEATGVTGSTYKAGPAAPTFTGTFIHSAELASQLVTDPQRWISTTSPCNTGLGNILTGRGAPSPAGNTAGNAATNPGTGGSGGLTSTTSRAGGSGAAGLVLVEEYF